MKRYAIFALAAAPLFAQGPAFDVATIKLSPPLASIGQQIMSGKAHIGMRVDGDRADFGNTSLAALIQTAYGVKGYQVTGPSWMTEQRFDIVAKIPDGATKEQVPGMLQKLLAERFKLTIHREKKDLPVYALVAGKGGLKLKEAAAKPEGDAPESPDATKNGFAMDTPNGRMSVSTSDKGAVVTSAKGGKMRVTMGPDRTMTMENERMTMEALAEQLSPMVDRPIFDMTGLKGSYQVTLELSMADLMQMARAQGVDMPMPRSGAGAPSDPSGSSAFQSVEKLGLKLDPRKMPVDLIVVDHIEKSPTEN